MNSKVLHGSGCSDYDCKNCTSVFESVNYSVGPDGEIDLQIREDGENCLVQCKQWRSQKNGMKAMREMFALIAAKQATGGIVITSGISPTQEALKFATGKPLKFVDGEQPHPGLHIVSSEPAVKLIYQETSNMPVGIVV